MGLFFKASLVYNELVRMIDIERFKLMGTQNITNDNISTLYLTIKEIICERGKLQLCKAYWLHPNGEDLSARFSRRS